MLHSEKSDELSLNFLCFFLPLTNLFVIFDYHNWDCAIFYVVACKEKDNLVSLQPNLDSTREMNYCCQS